MEITEVRIKLMESGEDRLRGFCSVTFDDAFVVRDLKIIEGNNGPFVAMPSRKLTSNCHKCHTKNHLRSNYCNNCGAKLRSDQVSHDSGGRAKLYADIAHPVNAQCREMIQNRVIEELDRELERSCQPGYLSRYDDGYDPLDRRSQPASKEPSASDEPGSDVTSSDLAAGRQSPGRTDSGHRASDHSPHTDSKPDPDSGSKPDNPNISPGRSKPAMEEFGKGIFD
jgi:stage V sporulation protein G